MYVSYHLTILPVSSRSASTLMRNQRNTPSWGRRRASISTGSPDANCSLHFSSSGARSSGWMATCQAEPRDSSRENPLYSCQSLFRNSVEPSGSMHQARAGIAQCREFDRQNAFLHALLHCAIFKTQATCPRKLSGKSGSSTESPAFETLNFNGVDDPSKVTDFVEFRSLMRMLRPDQYGRIA